MDDIPSPLVGTAHAGRDAPESSAWRDVSDLAQSLDDSLSKSESPFSRLMDMMVVMAQFGALRLFTKWDLLEKIPVEGSISYEALAGTIGAETALISRLGAALVTTKVLREVTPGAIAHTAHSLAYASPESHMRALACLGFDEHLKTLSQLPAYFDQFGLKEPTGKYNTPMAFASGDASLTVWDHVSRSPARTNNMMAAMAAMASKTPLVGNYDFSWIVTKATAMADQALVVDVGGGKGHALKAIHIATPGLDMARCVVQDVQSVVEEARRMACGVLQEAQFVPIDFHEAQPVKRALLYYIRRCLHDYGDDDCVGILRHISDAMASESRLLIVEQVLSDEPSAVSVANDIFMSFLGGKERTLDGFRVILGRAGLAIAKVYRSEGTDYAVLECLKTVQD